MNMGSVDFAYANEHLGELSEQPSIKNLSQNSQGAQADGDHVYLHDYALWEELTFESILIWS